MVQKNYIFNKLPHLSAPNHYDFVSLKALKFHDLYANTTPICAIFWNSMFLQKDEIFFPIIYEKYWPQKVLVTEIVMFFFSAAKSVSSCKFWGIACFSIMSGSNFIAKLSITWHNVVFCPFYQFGVFPLHRKEAFLNTKTGPNDMKICMKYMETWVIILKKFQIYTAKLTYGPNTAWETTVGLGMMFFWVLLKKSTSSAKRIHLFVSYLVSNQSSAKC